MEMNDWNEISKSYHEWIISPFQGADIDPLYERLEGVSGRREKSVADFGCGFFYLGKFLSEHYKSVHGSDFSEEMVKTARLINGRFKNVRIMREDMRTMRHDEAFDVVVIVNSVIMPSLSTSISANFICSSAGQPAPSMPESMVLSLASQMYIVSLSVGSTAVDGV